MTPMKSIRAFCEQCIVDSEVSGNGSAVQQIEDCTAKDCPLYEHRALTSKTKAKLLQKRINGMSEIQRQAYNIKADKARKILHKTRGNK